LPFAATKFLTAPTFGIATGVVHLVDLYLEPTPVRVQETRGSAGINGEDDLTSIVKTDTIVGVCFVLSHVRGAEIELGRNRI
jgi:hypothetical protein